MLLLNLFFVIILYMKLVSCYSCDHCKGIRVLQCIVADKATGRVIELNDQAVYDCDIFDIVTEDNECYDVKAQRDKSVNLNINTWKEN